MRSKRDVRWTANVIQVIAPKIFATKTQKHARKDLSVQKTANAETAASATTLRNAKTSQRSSVNLAVPTVFVMPLQQSARTAKIPTAHALP